MVLSCVFLWLNVWLSIISYVTGPLNFFFLTSHLCSWPQWIFSWMTCVFLCLRKKSFGYFSNCLLSSTFLCLFPCIQTSTFVLGLFYLYLIVSSCLSFHSALKKMFFNIISLTFSLLFKKCINKIWLIQFIDSSVLQFLIPDTLS